MASTSSPSLGRLAPLVGEWPLAPPSVWAAKFAARHPNLAVLDLSSFKCGHDAPTYGLIDAIIRGGRKPYMALHDLDANKPAGSLKIRPRH